MILDLITLSAIVVGVTEALKRAFIIPKRLIPLLSLAIAILLGGTAAFIGLTGLNLYEVMIAGLLSCGLWDFGKAPVMAVLDKIKKTPAIPPIKS